LFDKSCHNALVSNVAQGEVSYQREIDTFQREMAFKREAASQRVAPSSVVTASESKLD
jgi:hypothetical protein